MTVHFLGTGSANAGADRTTTMLAIEHQDRLVLVDCGGDAVQRMLAGGLDPVQLDAIILTHEHPDHLAGYPLLIEKLWLLGRTETIPFYGPQATLDKARALFSVFDTGKWDGLPERSFHPVALEPRSTVVTLGELVITASPVDHPVPTIGLRFETVDRTVAYSCDTAFADAVVALARGADLLIHEATGSLAGVHSSATEAAEAAVRSGAAKLLLVHAPYGASDDDLGPARAVFPDTCWASDGDQIEVG